MNDLLSLPLYIQVTLGYGYLSYIIASQGRRKNEKTYDVVLSTILYSIPSFGTWKILEVFEIHVIPSLMFMLVASVFTGIFWRKYFRSFWFAFLNESRISTDDGNSNVWTKLIQDTAITPTQIEVFLNNGKRLYCDDVQRFIDAPIPILQYDYEGNIALYVTHTKKEGKEYKPAKSLRNSSWGDMITYIPSSEITRVKIRYKKVI